MKNLKLLTRKRFRLLALLLCLTASIPQLWADDFYMLSSVTTWNRSDLLNDAYKMTESNGEWTWSYTPTSNGDFYFRIVGRASNGWYGDDIAASYDQQPITTTYQNSSWNTSYAWKLSVTAGKTYTFYKNSSQQVKYSVTDVVVPDTYVVAGPTEIFGSFWNGSDANNLMAEGNDGKYTLELNNVALTASVYNYYKIVKNGSAWIGDPNNNGENYKFVVPSNGTYDVTFTFDPSNNNCTVTYTLLNATGGEIYTVAGTNTTILGSEWTPKNTNNDMALQGNGLYQLTKNNVELGDNPSCSFKVVVNHAWGTAYPSDNASVTGFNGSGTYDIVFTYDPSTHEVTGVATKQIPPVDYYVIGDNNALWPGGWSTTDIPASQLMTNNDGTYTWAVQNVHLDFGAFGFKVYDSEGTYHPQNAGNVKIEVSAPGSYDLTITFDPSNSDDMPVVTLTPVTLDPLTYSVVGSAALFGGTDWGNAQTMTDDGDGTYSWDSRELTLNAGSYTFKVKDNMGNWFGTAGSNNGDDIVVNVPAYGTYTLHIDFDGSNAPTYQLHRVDIPTIYLTGDEALGLSWTPTPTTTMTYDDNTGLYTYTYYVNNSGTHRFIFANGQATGYSSEQIQEAWDYFNSHYRIGPINGDQSVALNASMTQTQMANDNHSAYQVTLGVGTYTIYYDPNNMTFRVEGAEPIYITGDLGLGLGWNYAPTTAMAYDDNTGLYSYTYKVPKQGTYNFVFANGQATGYSSEQEAQAWDYFNSNYRIGPNVAAEEYVVGTDNWKSTQMAGADKGAYSVKLAAGNVSIYFDKTQMQFKIESNGELGDDLYMVGGLTVNDSIHYYAPNDGVLMKYDNTKKLYYLNHVTLNTNATFCFSTSLGSNSEHWDGMGTRYGNADTDQTYFVPKEGDVTAHLKVTGDKINVNMPLNVWDENKGEWHMYTAGIYNVVVNIEDGWVKLIKTDQFSLFPMNVYLQKTNNVKIDNIGVVGHTYSAGQDGSNPWPLIAWNRLQGDWNPNSDANHYAVTFKGDTTTSDQKQWWHWEVSASIAEVMFTRTNQDPYNSPTIARKAGVLWYTWEEDNTMTAHSREYFTSSATALPGNVEVEEGHYYVYFINTVGWETVSCVAWSSQMNPYIDGHGMDVQTWPGQTMTCIGVDPMTGYEVWEYDFGAIDDSKAPDDLLFHDGTPIATTDAKEQTGDFDFINGGVYDYLGLFDDAYTLNSLIRTAHKNIRYTISNDLVGVYYDPDAQTEVTYKLSNGTDHTETVTGALYAKDLNDYGEKSEMPNGEEFYDYVYGICGTSGTDLRPSQVMDKKDKYDQSNWIKLVVSPNYDGGNPMPVDKPDLSKYVNRIIPGGKLQLYMTDSINPTARVMAIQMGDEMEYEPNVYISENFNDTVVFNYTHREWQLGTYKGVYRTQPHVEWKQNGVGGNIYAEVTRERVDDKTYKMFYVAPKPQEIAYITWVVYDNDNDAKFEGGPRPYGNYEPGVYTPYTTEGKFLPKDPGRFYSPRNFDRSENIPLSYLEDLVTQGKITAAQLDSLRNNYLSENELETIFGGYGQQYGPYANGYMQYGGIKVNWSLFDESKSGNEPWWQIFRPGQAYKFLAIIRYARGSEGQDSANNYLFGPSNGGEGETGTVFGAPRRAGSQTYFPNLYFTDDFKDEGLDRSKFIIFPIMASSAVSNGTEMGNVTDVKEIIQDVATPSTVASVRYYNLMGVESDKPFDGLNIVVTTYSDGSRTSKKILR